MGKWLKTGTLKRSVSRTEIRTTDLAATEITVDQQDNNHEVQRPTDWLVQEKGHYTSRVILQHDNARPHVANPVKTYLETLQCEVLPHPPYAPDIAPSDYHLFQSMEHGLAEQQFHSYEDAKKMCRLLDSLKRRVVFSMWNPNADRKMG
ncbi:Mariner Mos1 transposase [Araneus ventricosus]|uniref:Mariner Mos1 transposase n=1 Tax=Araneus ventricosus TaxID=182803 RepID=A0A4Y2RJH2_ARAVE|nr:Mariner Mos1 transposase [Araneus ventricosus]